MSCSPFYYSSFSLTTFWISSFTLLGLAELFFWDDDWDKLLVFVVIIVLDLSYFGNDLVEVVKFDYFFAGVFDYFNFEFEDVLSLFVSAIFLLIGFAAWEFLANLGSYLA